jgi:RimJ/RimL family protein N-acetyltransferase
LRQLILTTERLTIREFTWDDLDALHAMMNAAWDDDSTPLEARAAWLRWTLMSYRQYALLDQPPYGERAVTLTATGTLIGAVGIVPALLPYGAVRQYVPDGYQKHDLRVVPEIGLFWAIAPAHRRQGYATEAANAVLDYLFRDLWARRVVATTTDDNEGSVAVMRALGMSIERNPFDQPRWFQIVGVLEADAERPVRTQIRYQPFDNDTHEGHQP